mmetsp:Transcript_37365/g.86255  ORF Transcript_37365/g.86255 Transcript_37365/m.86255 type:complete len:309 (-) Transcript_37365:3225-4151(-)
MAIQLLTVRDASSFAITALLQRSAEAASVVVLTLHLVVPVARAAIRMLCARPGVFSIGNRAVGRVGRDKAKDLVCLADAITSFTVVLAAVGHKEPLAKGLARRAARCRGSSSRAVNLLQLAEDQGVLEREASAHKAALRYGHARVISADCVVVTSAVLLNLLIRLVRHGRAFHGIGPIFQHQPGGQRILRGRRDVVAGLAEARGIDGKVERTEVDDQDVNPFAPGIRHHRRHDPPHCWKRQRCQAILDEKGAFLHFGSAGLIRQSIGCTTLCQDGREEVAQVRVDSAHLASGALALFNALDGKGEARQ